MEILNIGPLELLLVFLIALVVLGPEEMVKTGKRISKGIVKIVRSPFWKSLVDTTQEIRGLPKKFIREAGLEQSIQELEKLNRIPPAFEVPIADRPSAEPVNPNHSTNESLSKQDPPENEGE